MTCRLLLAYVLLLPLHTLTALYSCEKRTLKRKLTCAGVKGQKGCGFVCSAVWYINGLAKQQRTHVAGKDAYCEREVQRKHGDD